METNMQPVGDMGHDEMIIQHLLQSIVTHSWVLNLFKHESNYN